MLIERGANVNYVDNMGATPLMLSTRKQDEKTAKILIKHRAKLNATDSDGDSALILAAANGENRLWKNG